MIINTLILAFVTGIISSFGHCLGMCGGIVAIYSARQAALIPLGAPPPTILTRIRRLLPLHLGRIVTYSSLGALIGLAGSLLNGLGGMVGWQGVFSIVVALSLMGVLPPVEAALVPAIGGASPMKKMRGLFGQQSFAATFGLGSLWGFLPCGLVFAMLVVATGTHSWWGGALTMFTFGLGTIPTLLGFGLAANLLSPKLRGRMQIFAGILILLFAIQTILRGLSAANIIPPLIIGPVMLW
jgi:sulfite exporter TauE/SafE